LASVYTQSDSATMEM